MPQSVYTKAEIDAMFATRDATLADHETRIAALESGPPPAAPTATFTATPASIESGQSALLEWATTNAASVTLDGVSVALSGSQSVSPTADKTYTLVATGPGGQVTETASVTVTQPSGFLWPGPAGDVVIPSGQAVVVDTLTAEARDIIVHGKLQASRTVNSKLIFRNLRIEADGELDYGTEASPIPASVTAELVFRNTPLDTTADPEQFGNGLMAYGKVRIHGVVKTSFVRLAAEPLAGQTVLTLAEPVNGWNPGDKLLIPDSRHLTFAEVNSFTGQTEVIVLDSVNGTALTLASPLAFDHKGWHNGEGVLDLGNVPHVGNLSRNVIIRSENPLGTRGHIMYRERADVDRRYSHSIGLGRTTIADGDDTTFDTQGNVTHIGTNQRGRYDEHYHHCNGPVSPQGNGRQFTSIGNVMEGGDGAGGETNHKWGITVHDSHYGLIEDNIVYNWAGAGIVCEDGSETENLFHRNLVCRVRGTGERADSTIPPYRNGREGSGFWMRGQNSRFVGNVATDVAAYGFTFICQSLGFVPMPATQGADMANYVSIDTSKLAIRQFDDNECYRASSGLEFWGIGVEGNTIHADAAPTTILRFKAWHHYTAGLFPYQSNKVTLDSCQSRGSFAVILGGVGNSQGIAYNDYLQQASLAVNCDVQGNLYGIVPSTQASTGYNVPVLVQEYRGCHLRNVHNFIFQSSYTSGDPTQNGPSQVIIRNCLVEAPPGYPLDALKMEYLGGGAVVQLRRLDAFDWQQVVGDNFRAYFVEQDPAFIVPQTNLPAVYGSPDAGKTNAQNWADHGIAIAGAVSPTTQTRAGIVGHVQPV